MPSTVFNKRIAQKLLNIFIKYQTSLTKLHKKKKYSTDLIAVLIYSRLSLNSDITANHF